MLRLVSLASGEDSNNVINPDVSHLLVPLADCAPYTRLAFGREAWRVSLMQPNTLHFQRTFLRSARGTINPPTERFLQKRNL